MVEIKGNEAQREAIALYRGPALVLAGPGSGKTFTIVERIAYLIDRYQVLPEQILVVTFTKAAARQMRARFENRMDGVYSPVMFGTFHAIFFQILKQSCQYPSDAILSEKEKTVYLRRALATLPGDFLQRQDWENGLLGEFGYLKNLGYCPGDFRSAYLEEHQFRQAFIGFQRILREDGRLDFDDFASHCLQLFRKKPEILTLWQKKFSFILVDEFQDINPVQYEVIKLLAKGEENLFVVGDDDQSIYGFRGARPEIMRRFLEDFPGARQIVLSRNYRSRRGIVEAADRLIRNNKDRFCKQIRAVREEKEVVGETERDGAIGSGGKAGRGIKDSLRIWRPLRGGHSVLSACFTDRERQAEEVALQIQRLLESGDGSKPAIAVILRTHSDAQRIAAALTKNGTSYLLREEIKSPFTHYVCQDLLAYLQFIFGRRERSLFLRIMNKPMRYLSRQAVQEGPVCRDNLLQFYRDKPWMQETVRRFFTGIERMEKMDLYAALSYIRRGMGYEEWLYEKTQGQEREKAMEMVGFFRDSIRQFRSLEEFLAYVRDCEKQFGTDSFHKGGAREKRQEGANLVELMTMHTAKGLEFDQVFLPDCNEGIVPHKKSLRVEEIEEERRMFYVGMTRAREGLYVSWVSGTKEEPLYPSRFLKEFMGDSV